MKLFDLCYDLNLNVGVKVIASCSKKLLKCASIYTYLFFEGHEF